MAELPGEQFVTDRQLPRFGRAMMRGFIISHAMMRGDAHVDSSDPLTRVGAFRVRTPSPTETSPGNKIRLGVTTIPTEWSRWRRRMTGEIFTLSPEQFSRVVRRRMAPPRKLDKIIPSERVLYRAKMYGGDPAEEGVASGVPQFSGRGGRRRFYDS